MAEYVKADEAIANTINLLSQAAGERLKFLLETKHLYQKVSIAGDEIITANEATVQPHERTSFRNSVKQRLDSDRFWPLEHNLRFAKGGVGEQPTLLLPLRTVKLFCSECDSSEVFSPLWSADFTNEILKARRSVGDIGLPNTFQLFFLTYQCQLCKGTPQAFIIRRDGWYLLLEGRSPIERTPLPPFIPKKEGRLFSDAVVAMRAGKTLAALFYLRTFIEQFARRQTGKAGRFTGDELMEAYSAMLPSKQRDQMPSLKAWYNKISEALHDAREDAALFEEAREAIEHHFDIRRVFRIPDSTK